MPNLEFPLLAHADIDVRVARFKEGKGYSLLLYKDARVDMRILDDVVGPMNWQREPFSIDGKMHCRVSVWDSEKEQWVSKSDVGTESNTDAVKGESSDAFKRACFNWGIGRELYTAPFVWVPDKTISKDDLKYTSFRVSRIEYTGEREIAAVEIINAKTNAIVFSSFKGTGTKAKDPKPKAQPKKLDRRAEVAQRAKTAGITPQAVADLIQSSYSVKKVDDLTTDQYDDLLALIDNHKEEIPA